ncbi:MAG: signal peptidase I [Actinobacteria bacterium]|nr:signal peptidase I [Actinomycetota bacterium]NBY16053.1 signal peptidase I [Actinomycetota bacterium]
MYRSKTKTRLGRRAVANEQRTILAAITLFLLMGIALTSVASATYIMVKQIHFSRVLSDSMKPEFKRGDLLLVKPVDRLSLEKGDIAVLPILGEPGSQFAHRIINVERTNNTVQVQTKGDANPVIDPWKLTITSRKVPVVVSSIPASIVPLVSLNRYVLTGLFALLCLLFISLLTPRRMREPESD